MAFLLRLTGEVVHPHLVGDTSSLIAGAGHILPCWQAGKWGHCGEASQFSLLFYFPAFPLKLLGFTDRMIEHALGYLSYFAFFATLIRLWRFFRGRSPRVAAWAALSMATGTLLSYAFYNFSEMTAAWVLLLLGVMLVQGAKTGWVFALMFLAATTKETSAPFLILLTAAAALARWRPESVAALRAGWARDHVRLIAAGAGLGLGVVANLLFNFFRYGTYRNTVYLNLKMPPVDAIFSTMTGSWFSPSGGHFWFWPVFFVTFVGLLGVGLGRRSPPWRRGFSALILLAHVGLTLGFSLWWSPWGWMAWGHRLYLPWIPVTIFLLLYAFEAEVEAGLAALARRTMAFWSATGALVLVSLPQFLVIFNQWLNHRQFELDTVCQHGQHPYVDERAFWNCWGHRLWSPDFWILTADYGFIFRHPAIGIMTALYLYLIWRLLLRLKNTDPQSV
ncbi:MAG: hypothetical protein AB7P04_03850 [Bacteriovoracia bacterium]